MSSKELILRFRKEKSPELLGQMAQANRLSLTLFLDIKKQMKAKLFLKVKM